MKLLRLSAVCVCVRSFSSVLSHIHLLCTDSWSFFRSLHPRAFRLKQSPNGNYGAFVSTCMFSLRASFILVPVASSDRHAAS